jgi:MFS family permease
MLVGTVTGIGVAAGTYPQSTFIGIAVGMGLGALTLFAVRERPPAEHLEERAHVSDWNDFTVVFVARAFLAFGLALLMTFVLYFFRDILHAANPSAGTGMVAGASLIGAIASGIFLGWLSDRVSRKLVVALCGIPMAAAAAGFALLPQERWMFAFALLFGIGFGGIMSTGWALAMDSVPKLRDVARDLGIWGIAQNLPMVIAPLAGGWLLSMYAYSLPGYRVLFLSSAGSFLLGSAVVLMVGQRPVIPLWAVPLRLASAVSLYVYTHLSWRIRKWGRLEPSRGPSLVISNHQIEEDMLEPMGQLALSGGWKKPVLTASARLMYEPGFMAQRFPWMWRLLRNVNLGWLFEGMGMLPLENQLQTRSITRWAWAVQRRHGVLPLAQIFKPAALAGTSFESSTTAELFSQANFCRADATPMRLSDLQVAYRKELFDEMKLGVEQDVALIVGALKRGATFYVTPEGEYTKTGAMLPFRGIWEMLLPHAQHVYVLGISYDPFAGRRLSQLYRVVEARSKETALAELKASRPVTSSALAAEWLLARTGSFGAEEFQRAIEARLHGLPPGLFVDPELAAATPATVRNALREMTKLGILLYADGRYSLSTVRKHPYFPEVDDIVAFQARFFAETLESIQALTMRPTPAGLSA